MLKQTGRWRRWLGLKGTLWYYTEEEPERGTLYKALPIITPVVALLVTGYISYTSVRVTRQTFTATHVPVLRVVRAELSGTVQVGTQTAHATEFLFEVQNDGDATAINVSLSPVSLIEALNHHFWDLNPTNTNRNFHLEDELPPKSKIDLYSDVPDNAVALPIPKNSYLAGAIVYSNIIGRRQPGSEFCLISVDDYNFIPCESVSK